MTMQTMFTFDTNEMVEVAQLLEVCARECDDVGSRLSACTQCAMTPQVRSMVDQLVAVVDRVLDEVAVRLLNEAIELVQRAISAQGDPVGAMTASDLLGGVAVIGGNTSPAFTILGPDGTPASPGFMTMTIGGNTSPGFTILNPDGTSASPGFTTMTIGGNTSPAFTVGGPNGSPGWSQLFGGVSVVGGGTARPDPISELVGRRMQRERAELDRLFRSPNSAPHLGQLLDAMDAHSDTTSHILAPSRAELEREEGHTLTIPEIRSISPMTLPSVFR